MNRRIQFYVATAFALIVFPVSATVVAQSPTALALQSIFSPQRAPANKTMGLTQRNFIDLVENSQRRLEIAFVVDGTESMGGSLKGIRSAYSDMIEDLNLFKETEPAFQLVVFRDAGSAAGEVSFPMAVAGKKFTTDRSALGRAIDSIAADTGAPYFPELVDKGVHAALSELEWSKDEQTTRWLMVFGDAPPYDVGFDESDTKASRRYDTSYLVSLAERKGININCILCTSRDEEQVAYESVLEKTRRFMSTLSNETGGLMLDLSYPDIRTALEEAAQKERVGYSKIGAITEDELDRLRDSAERQKSQLAASRRVRLAVLPHLPLRDMSFDRRRKEVLIAADLREKLRRVPGIEVKSPTVIKRQLPVLLRRGIKEDQMLQALATVLNVDYVLWGEIQSENDVDRYASAIYEGASGAKLAEGTAIANIGSRTDDATSQLTRGLITSVLQTRSDNQLVSTFAGLNDVPGGGNLVLTPVSNEPAARDSLLAGYDALEDALAFVSGDEKAAPLLKDAEASLSQALANDRDNAFAHLLLSNCLFAQAHVLKSQGESQQAADKMQQFRAELNRANRSQNKLRRADLRTEVKADFALFVRQDGTREAVQLYESLTGSSGPGDDKINLETALRAHWMLAGIFSGDWGAGEPYRDAEKAREHLAQILAHWPDSPQAKLIRTDLRWDEDTGRNGLESFPRRHESLFD